MTDRKVIQLVEGDVFGERDDAASDGTFPLESLVGHYADYVLTVAASTQTCTAATGASALGGVSAAVGTRLLVRINPSWCYHSGLYIVLSGPASYGKGGILESVDQPIRAHEDLLRADRADLIRQSRAELVHLTAEIDAKKGELRQTIRKGDSNDKSDVAPDIAQEIADLEERLEELQALAREPQLIQDDFTFETTGEIMKLNHERMSVVSADTEIFNTHRYSDNPAIGILLKAWKGEEHREDRERGKTGLDLKSPAMAMLVATQTENIKALCQKNRALVYRGYMSRFLAVVPTSTVGFRDKRAAIMGGGIPHSVQAQFNAPLVELAQRSL